MDHDGCTYSVVYGGEVRISVQSEGSSAHFDFDVPYHTTITAGDLDDCDDLFGLDGEFSILFSTPTEQAFTEEQMDFGPGWTRVDVVLAGTVPVVGPFSLALTLKPYSLIETDVDEDGFLDRVYASTQNITLNFEPVR